MSRLPVCRMVVIFPIAHRNARPGSTRREDRLSLSGTLYTMPLTDLLQWLDSARKTGTLAVRGARHTKRIYLKEGRIISSSSDDPTEQLGQFLLLSLIHISEP